MIKVQSGQTFHTHKGYLKLDDLIGKEFGEPIKSSLGVTFTTLKPKLTDYMMKSGRNTQIVYPKDAALIVMFSGIGPGSRVFESGTGTGALNKRTSHTTLAQPAKSTLTNSDQNSRKTPAKTSKKPN